MKKLNIFVYRCSEEDSTNGGVSANANSLTLVIYENGETPNPADGDLMLVRRVFLGNQADYLRPIAEPDEGCLGWIMGGHFGYTCDGRFSNWTGNDCPLPIYDRQETPIEYDRLSR